MSVKLAENKRAAYAFEVVETDIFKLSEDERKEYRSYIKRMPMMIKVNGLGQTLAFYFSKGGTYKVVYKRVADWIFDHYAENLGIADEDKKKEFVNIIINLESDTYRMATTEIMSLLNWMRRFADGIAKNGNGTND